MMDQQSGKYYIDPIYLKVSVRTYNCDVLQNLQCMGKHQNFFFFFSIYALQQAHNMNSFRQMQYI